MLGVCAYLRALVQPANDLLLSIGPHSAVLKVLPPLLLFLLQTIMPNMQSFCFSPDSLLLMPLSNLQLSQFA